MDENESDENKESGYEEESEDRINETLHGKPADNLVHLHFSYENDTDAYVGLDKNTNKKHKVRDNEMVTFDKTTVKLLQNMQFQSKVIKFVLGSIPRFDKEISEMKKLRMHFHQYQSGK